MDGFQVSGQLDVGPPGNIEDAAADFMEYMAFAYKGGFEGLVVYEIESDEAGGDSFTFCFDIDKKGTRAFVGEPHSEANLKITMNQTTFHRVFFASPSKWELGSLMMKGFIRVQNNQFREVASFASRYDYSRWDEFYRVFRPNRGADGEQSAVASPAIARQHTVHRIPILKHGVFVTRQATAMATLANDYTQGTCVKFLSGARELLQLRIHINHPCAPLLLSGISQSLFPDRSAPTQSTAPTPEIVTARIAEHLLRGQLSVLAAARTAHDRHLMSVLAHTAQLHPTRRRRVARYTGPGTPPSTGVVEKTTLISSLPTSAAVLCMNLPARTFQPGIPFSFAAATAPQHVSSTASTPAYTHVSGQLILPQFMGGASVMVSSSAPTSSWSYWSVLQGGARMVSATASWVWPWWGSSQQPA